MRRALAALLGGSLLAVAPPAGWSLLRESPSGEFGAAAAEQLAAPPPAAPTTPPPSPPTGLPSAAPPVEPAPVPPAPAVATRPARLAEVVQRDPPAQVHVAGRTAPVDAVGLDPDGQVVVPDDVRRAGWYALGPQPGDAAGSAVLVGHADSQSQGLGTFAGLRDLTAGAEVVVRTAGGRGLVYEVVSFERFSKAEVPMDRLFAVDGPHRLVLISCGGAFDEARRTYADNVVVTAVPRT